MEQRTGRRMLGGLVRVLVLLLPLTGVGLAPSNPAAEFPSLPVEILGAEGRPVGKARIFSNYLEISGPAGKARGAVGVVMVEGRPRLFLVGAGGEQKLVGWAEDHRVFNGAGKLVGFYQWTAIWSYVYDGAMKKVGQARCLAYQGVCAAGIAGFLLGLF